MGKKKKEREDSAMQIGIRLHDMAPGTLARRLETARRQGFCCAHVALSKTVDGFKMSEAEQRLTPEFAAEMKALFASTGQECVLLGCYMHLTTLDEAQLERTRDIYRAHFRFARKIGCAVVGTETPPAKDYTGDVHSEEALERFIQCIAPLARSAEEAGVKLAIEPVAKDIVSTPERAERVLDALKSDHVGIILDAVNLLSRDNYDRADAIVDEAIRRLGDRVCLLHMKDFTVDPQQFMTKACACGTGMMRYERLMRFAIQNNLAMTLENTNPGNAEATRLFLENLRG